MVGSLMYLSASRPDIVFAVCMCARYQAKPTEMHLHAITADLRYIKGTFTWVCGCHVTRRKVTSGSAQFLGHRIVRWSYKKHENVLPITTEAEYIALSGCCAQIYLDAFSMRDYGFAFNKISMYI
ncbi:hypothetical protein Tco_1143459 [Tanacetum coccineum]